MVTHRFANRLAAGILAGVGFLLALEGVACAQVAITVDNSKPHQIMEGFGVSHDPLVYQGSLGDVLSASQRARAIDWVYNQVRINLGNLECGLLESPGDYSQRQNDNGDPFTVNWAGFQGFAADQMKLKLLDAATPLGFAGFYVHGGGNVRWASPWLDALRTSNYSTYLDECAEQVEANATYWKVTHGVVPERYMIFNEPTSGNGELLNGTAQDVVDITKRSGDRLRRRGIDTMMFVAPNEETVQRSFDTATALMQDPGAKTYVRTIGYHCYPYGSAYASIPNILSGPGAGSPSAAEISARNALRDLGKQHGKPVWMTEVSHGEIDPLSFDALRGRAIHIHDELEYADASAYFGMLNMWDRSSQIAHTGNSNLLDPSNEGTIAFIDQTTDTVYKAAIGYAIGHYARWIKPGAVRLEASVPDPLVLISAFRDGAQGRLVIVAINNATGERTLSLSATGLSLSGNVTGEQSSSSAFWSSILPFAPSSPTQIRLVVPAKSVTTLSCLASADGTGPPPSVTSPPSSTTSSPLVLSGTASPGTIGVTWTNAATGQSGTAAGTSSWAATVPLAPGSNQVTITAMSGSGGSGTRTITVIYSPPAGGGSSSGGGGCGLLGLEGLCAGLLGVLLRRKPQAWP